MGTDYLLGNDNENPIKLSDRTFRLRKRLKVFQVVRSAYGSAQTTSTSTLKSERRIQGAETSDSKLHTDGVANKTSICASCARYAIPLDFAKPNSAVYFSAEAAPYVAAVQSTAR
jgi:hypothetical protein